MLHKLLQKASATIFTTLHSCLVLLDLLSPILSNFLVINFLQSGFTPFLHLIWTKSDLNDPENPNDLDNPDGPDNLDNLTQFQHCLILILLVTPLIPTLLVVSYKVLLAMDFFIAKVVAIL